MSDDRTFDSYFQKATESLAGAESEYVNGRLNNCVNRAYYAAFQAAIPSLLAESIRAGRNHWTHTFVRSRFVAQVINRRHRYPLELHGTLSELGTLRQTADYDSDPISPAEADRCLRRSRECVEAIGRGGDASR